ncbi:hypothetical protein QE422_001671 [Chryseobacterium sp. SORGH_AS 447]|nr:hypothetical protein [Chryseobacterium sp. SORGH_AS_0447]
MGYLSNYLWKYQGWINAVKLTQHKRKQNISEKNWVSFRLYKAKSPAAAGDLL